MTGVWVRAESHQAKGPHAGPRVEQSPGHGADVVGGRQDHLGLYVVHRSCANEESKVGVDLLG
jgi:hypothetical protein